MCVCTFCFSSKINEVIYFPEKLLEAQLSPSSATHQKTSHDSFAQNVKQVDYTPQLHRERKEVTLVLRDVCVSLPSFSSLQRTCPTMVRPPCVRFLPELLSESFGFNNFYREDTGFPVVSQTRF